MYPWLWRHLPGRWPVRLLIAVLAVAVAVLVLFAWVFPELAPLVPGQDVDVR